MDFQEFLSVASKILPNLPVTLLMVFLALFGGLILGLVLAIVRIRNKPISTTFATAFISFMRCTPTLVQLFLVFYGLPQLFAMFGADINDWTPFTFAIIALALHSSATLSEVIRSAYLSVQEGQFEACLSVGMTYFQSLRRIILPQAYSIAIPNLGNSFIVLFKETSLAFSIGVVDIMGKAEVLIKLSYGINIIEVYVFISILYWVCSVILSRLIKLMDERNRGSVRKFSRRAF